MSSDEETKSEITTDDVNEKTRKLVEKEKQERVKKERKTIIEREAQKIVDDCLKTPHFADCILAFSYFMYSRPERNFVFEISSVKEDLGAEIADEIEYMTDFTVIPRGGGALEIQSEFIWPILRTRDREDWQKTRREGEWNGGQRSDIFLEKLRTTFSFGKLSTGRCDIFLEKLIPDPSPCHQNKMDNLILASTNPFEDEDVSKAGASVHIRYQARNGKKCITLIEGLPSDLDHKKILKHIKKTFSTNGAIMMDDDLPVIKVQGDIRDKVAEFLVKMKVCEKEEITIHGGDRVVAKLGKFKGENQKL